MEQNYKDKLIIEKLNNLALIQAARSFSNQGFVVRDGDYTYLKIDDGFIHDLYHLINEHDNLAKPDYFSKQNPLGAHITLIYPSEAVIIRDEDVNIIHSFEVIELVKTLIELKEHYILMINSVSLCLLRKKYNLPINLNFKGYETGFHITIATCAVEEEYAAIKI